MFHDDFIYIFNSLCYKRKYIIRFFLTNIQYLRFYSEKINIDFYYINSIHP